MSNWILSHTSGNAASFRKVLESGYIMPRALMPESDAFAAKGYMIELLKTKEELRNFDYAYFSILLDVPQFTTSVFPYTFILPTTILRGVQFYPQHEWTTNPDETRQFTTKSIAKINKELGNSTALRDMSPNMYNRVAGYANILSQVIVTREIPIASALYVMLPAYATDDDIVATRRVCPSATLMLKCTKLLDKDMQIHRPLRLCTREITTIREDDMPLIIAANTSRLTPMDISQFVLQIRVSGDAWLRAVNFAKQFTIDKPFPRFTKDEEYCITTNNFIVTQLIGCMFDVSYASRRFYPAPAAFTRFIRAALKQAKGDVKQAGYSILKAQIAAKIADYIDGVIDLHEIATRKIE